MFETNGLEYDWDC